MNVNGGEGKGVQVEDSDRDLVSDQVDEKEPITVEQQVFDDDLCFSASSEVSAGDAGVGEGPGVEVSGGLVHSIKLQRSGSDDEGGREGDNVDLVRIREGRQTNNGDLFPGTPLMYFGNWMKRDVERVTVWSDKWILSRTSWTLSPCGPGGTLDASSSNKEKSSDEEFHGGCENLGVEREKLRMVETFFTRIQESD